MISVPWGCAQDPEGSGMDNTLTMAERNRIIAERLGWPEGAAGHCRDLEQRFPGYTVWYGTGPVPPTGAGLLRLHARGPRHRSHLPGADPGRTGCAYRGGPVMTEPEKVMHAGGGRALPGEIPGEEERRNSMTCATSTPVTTSTVRYSRRVRESSTTPRA